jgi:coenzyme F420-0:L-glutamate ligase / coenzyme F420-1:gamma-L-glutamate ligase
MTPQPSRPAGPSTDPAPAALTCLPVDGLGEVVEGDDLAAVIAAAVALADGDILVLTSKAVSKAEGRVLTGSRDDLLAAETDRVVARRGSTSIVRTHHGLVMAAAGVDASNTAAGTVVLLPKDPDRSARRLRESLAERTGRNVAVVVTDTAGRAWRTGQTDIAIGAAGLDVLHDYAGSTDPHGNELAVTAPAVADELAAAADLVKRKLDRRPAAVVRGLAPLVLPAGRHGPGAAALVRPEAQDMFGLGAREAVLAALLGEEFRGFGAPSTADDLVTQLSALVPTDVEVTAAGTVRAGLPGAERERGSAEVLLRTAAFALGWRVEPALGNVASLMFVPQTT